MFQSIVVAVDGSDQASRAVKVASELARVMNAKLHLVYVVDSNHMQIPEDMRRMGEAEHIISPLPPLPLNAVDAPPNLLRSISESSAATQRNLYELAEYIVNQAKRDAIDAGTGNIETSVEVGNPADRIIAYAKSNKADLIVMGRRGLSPIKSLLLGSTSHKVSLHAECNCLTVN